MPFAIGYLVWRVGYDKRGLQLWTLASWILLLVCYFFMPAPPPPPGSNPNLPVNINYVHGMSDAAAQTWMHPTAWFLLLLFGLPALIFYPTHMFLHRYAPKAQDARGVQP